jgi:hypothetical protein
MNRIFFISVVVILTVTGILKTISAFSGVKFLALRDQVFTFLTIQQLLIAIAILELSIVLLLLIAKSDILKLYVIAWFSSCLIIYRVGLAWIKPNMPCPCLGRVTDWLHIRYEVVNCVLEIICFYLFCCSCGLLVSKLFSYKFLKPSKA